MGVQPMEPRWHWYGYVVHTEPSCPWHCNTWAWTWIIMHMGSLIIKWDHWVRYNNWHTHHLSRVKWYIHQVNITWCLHTSLININGLSVLIFSRLLHWHTHLKLHLSLFLFQIESILPARGTPPMFMNIFPRCTDVKINSQTTTITGNRMLFCLWINRSNQFYTIFELKCDRIWHCNPRRGHTECINGTTSGQPVTIDPWWGIKCERDSGCNMQDQVAKCQHSHFHMGHREGWFHQKPQCMPPGWQPFSGVQIVNKGVKVAVLLWRGRKLKGRWLTYSQGFFLGRAGRWG